MNTSVADEVQLTDPKSTSAPTPGWWIVLATVPFAIGVLAQRFGEIFYLTRLDRVLEPGTMMSRAFDLWNPFWDMGSLGYQQSGYWLPFDLWFGTTNLLHLPTWVSQRLYVFTFFALAVWGFTRLADALNIGRPWTRIVAAVAYGLSPVILSRIAWQSPFAMGAVFLPWALIPLIRASAGGSVRRAAARSAIAIALIGGANAAVTLAVIPIPFLYLLTRSRGPRRAQLMRWWLFAVFAATLWWVVGLMFLARYAPDVLLYTESAAATTGPTAIFDVLRGTADWVSRLPGPTNPAGFALTLRTLPILATTVVAAAGVAGLARRRLRERTFLILCLLLGVAAIGGGFGGLFATPFADAYRSLLDGPLNAFRNVYKFQPLIALPLSLGVAHLLSAIDLGRLKRATQLLLAATIAITLAIAAWPLWTNSLSRGPGFDEIPTAWKEANTWLAQNADARVLVLPGIPDAEFDWGFTQLLPIELESGITWAYRSQAPLSGVEILTYLDGIETAIERGGDAALPSFLRRGGFAYVVVPNDQQSEKFDAPSAESVRNAMLASGFEQIAGFGERTYGFGDLQQIEIYRVPTPAVATTYTEASLTWLSGDITSVLDVPENLFGKRPYVLVPGTTSPTPGPEQWIITDGNQAVTTDFGLNRNNKSYIHGSSDTDQYSGKQPLDQTYMKLPGFESITATSVGPGIIRTNLPAYAPAHIVDGDPETFWSPRREQVDGPLAWGSVDPAIKVEFTQPTVVDDLSVSLYLGVYANPTPIEVTVRTDNGVRTSQLFAVQTPQNLDVAGGPTSSLTVSIARSSYAAADDAIGIRELTLPGAPVTPRLVVPAQLSATFAQPSAPDPAWVFTRNKPPLSPIVSINNERQLAREFTVPKNAVLRTAAIGSASRTQRLLDWLGTTPTLSISADSTWANNPNVSPRNLIDGSTTSPWRSGHDITDKGGSSLLSMRWNGPRTFSSLRLVRTEADAQPTEVVIYAGSNARRAPVAPDGTVSFDALTTDAFTMQLNYAPVDDNDSSSSKQIGFTSIDIPALADLYPGPLDRTAPYVGACGAGPSATVGTTTITYAFATTVDTLLTGTTVPLTPCGTDSVNLPAGTTQLDASNGSSLITIDQFVLGNNPTMAAPPGSPRPVTIDDWGTNDRTVNVGGGAAGLLVVNEAFNRGWAAELDGASLTPMLIDGWRQGFVLPEGDGGTVHLRFAPDRPFKLGTVFGILALLFVGALAVWPSRSPRMSAPLTTGRAPTPLLVAAVLGGGVWCTGIGVVLLAPLWWLRTKHRSWLAPVALCSMTLAGILAVIAKRYVEVPSNLWGVTSMPVSALAATAFLCALITVLPADLSVRRSGRRERSPNHRDSSSLDGVETDAT